ncbi:hypothetical protein [Sporofaciens musculi]|uniref:hypothetical protein n=1 Tax=Sporofaciens musculi TaxID=2681861 RepID=UPI00259C7EDF|nr:hypothetical protein [Sporofaciens musculi]
MEMQMKWQQKKSNNDFTADGTTKLTDPIARQAEQIRLAQADGSSKLSSQIRAKLASGKKLSREEMEYLQKNDPQTYQKAKAMEEEQKSYEEELKRCETKEDVQRVRMNRTAASLSVVKSVESNSAIPESAKLGIMWQELMKSKALEETINKFIESGRYAQLPTEAEKLEAEKALEEAKAAESEIEVSDTDTNESDTDNMTEDISKDKANDTSPHESEQRKRAILQEHRMTLAEAETTPEALKVKRAKAHAAYKENHAQVSEQIMDFKN